LPTLSTIESLADVIQGIRSDIEGHSAFAGCVADLFWSLELDARPMDTSPRFSFEGSESLCLFKAGSPPPVVAWVLRRNYIDVGVGEPTSCAEKFWGENESSEMLRPLRTEYIRQNDSLGYNLVMTICRPLCSEGPSGRMPTLSGLIVATELGKAVEGVIVVDEAWSHPLYGAYHWSEVKALLPRL